MRNVDNAAAALGRKCLTKQRKQQLQLAPSPAPAGPTQPFIASDDVRAAAAARTYGLRLKLIFLPLGGGKSQKLFRRS